MDAWVLYAVNTFFVVAVAAPPLLVIIYRWREVPLRRAEIETMVNSAFKSSDPETSKAAREALANNPYISDPEETFDRYHSPWRYVLPVILLTVLTVCSASLVYSWVRHRIDSRATAISSVAPATPAPSNPPAGPIPRLPVDSPLVIVMALTGGYIWSVYQIGARSRASELSPADLYEIDIGLLAAVPVGLAFSLITAELEGVRSFMAFAASAFPLRDVSRMVRQYATRKMLDSADTSASRPSELHLGTAIEGLSDQNLARLSELRITTVLDIAYCDPFRVMVQTGFPLPVVVDWMDQSLWALYVGDLKTKINKCGIRCSLDVCEFVDLHLRDCDGAKKEALDGSCKEALEALAQQMGCPALLLKDLLFRIDVDPQVVVLRKLWYPMGVPKELRALRNKDGK